MQHQAIEVQRADDADVMHVSTASLVGTAMPSLPQAGHDWPT